MQPFPDGLTDRELLAHVQHIVDGNVHAVLRRDGEEGGLGSTEQEKRTHNSEKFLLTVCFYSLKEGWIHREQVDIAALLQEELCRHAHLRSLHASLVLAVRREC